MVNNEKHPNVNLRNTRHTSYTLKFAPEHGIQNTEHGTRNTEYRTQNTEHGTRNTEYRIQNTEHRTQNTEHGTRTIFHKFKYLINISIIFSQLRLLLKYISVFNKCY